MAKLSLGLDYGTNSVRALLVDTASGDEVATAVFEFKSGEAGILLDERDPNLARQNPTDYIDGLYETAREILKGVDPTEVVGIGVDTTGSSPMPIDAKGTPLAFDPRFKSDLAGQCWLWKDHTAHEEAAEITESALERGEPYLAKCGGTYSSEWFWSKILHCARTSPKVFEAADSWVECCDWVVGHLTGNTEPRVMKRSVCAAGHKAMYADDWGGLPSADFLSGLDPKLAELRERLYDKAEASDVVAGGISAEVAEKTGLREGIPVAVGGIDAHYGAVGSGVRPGVMVKILGTSSCDCMVHPLDSGLPDVQGISGIVRGSILPGFFGLEAGQAAVGDIFNWAAKHANRTQEALSSEAAELRAGESGLLSLDWNNGNRNVLGDPLLSGVLLGQSLHTTAAESYRAAIEATAFGALKIIKRLEEYGVRVEEIVACGGIAEKSPLVLQIYADVCNRPMKLARSVQACALGAAVFGAVVGGAHPSVAEAQAAMTGTKDVAYLPDPVSARVYERLFRLYSDLHDAFGRTGWHGGLSHVMKELIAIRDEARA